MATKNDKYLFNEQSFTASENQGYNLNLNQNKKYATSIPVQSNSKPNNDKNRASNNYEENEKLQSWNKSFKVSTFTTLSESYDDLKKRWKNENTLKSINKSTLSLHIAAYENSTETHALDLFNETENNNGLKREKFGSIKNGKQCFTDIIKFQNPFEFPRQQEEDGQKFPENMKYKSDQVLMGSSNVTQNHSEINNKTLSTVEDLKSIKYRMSRKVITAQIIRLKEGISRYGGPYKFFTCAVQGANEGNVQSLFSLQCFGKSPSDKTLKSEIIMRKVDGLQVGDTVTIQRIDKADEKKEKERRSSSNFTPASNDTCIVFRVHENTLISKIASASSNPISDLSSIHAPMNNVTIICYIEQDCEHIDGKYMIVGRDNSDKFVELWSKEEITVVYGEQWRFGGNVKVEDGTPVMEVQKWQKNSE